MAILSASHLVAGNDQGALDQSPQFGIVVGDEDTSHDTQ